MKKIIFKFNGLPLNQSPNINKCLWVKNLLRYSNPYETAASNSFDYFDENRSTTITTRRDDDPNHLADFVTPATKITGFYKRHNAILNNNEVDAIVSLNRYGFFESLKEEICPQGTVVIDITLETANNIIYRTGGNAGRVVFTSMMLYVPKLIFTGFGDELYLKDYLKTHSWSYLDEFFQDSQSTQATQGTFRITTSIKQPRHVFVWAIQTNREGSQTNNIFFAETFSIGANNVHLTSSQLELGNGNYYPSEVLNPWANAAMAYRILMSYNEYYNDPLSGPQISFDTFKTIYPIMYFNLDNQPDTIRTGVTKLSFRWQLDGAPGADYKWYAVVLSEQTIRLVKESNRAFLKN